MHIGLFGGTFNPIHCCHLRIAEQVESLCKLDRIIFIPTGDPPHKDSASLASAHHRLTMVKKAVENKPSFTVSDIEAQCTSVSYTIETVTRLQQENRNVTQWSFIIGLDAFLEFHTWKKAPQLLSLCHFIICSRPGADFTKLSDVTCLPPLAHKALIELQEGQRTQCNIHLPSAKHLTLLALPPCEASASMIRKDIRRGLSVSHWLPPVVESYILEHHLYHPERI